MVRALVSEHATWLSAFLRSLTRSEADAEDAFQEVWLRLIKQGGLPEGASARAYLAQTARSVVVDRYRREGREEVTEFGDEAMVSSDPAPDVRHEAEDARAKVRAAVRALPLKLREIVMLRVEAELTFAEIAESLQLPLGTVLTRMRTATERLKAVLEEK